MPGYLVASRTLYITLHVYYWHRLTSLPSNLGESSWNYYGLDFFFRRFSSLTSLRKDVYVAIGGEEKRSNILNSLEFFDHGTWINQTNLRKRVKFNKSKSRFKYAAQRLKLRDVLEAKLLNVHFFDWLCLLCSFF